MSFYLCVFDIESAGWVDRRDWQNILRQALKFIQDEVRVPDTTLSSHATMTNLARGSYLSTAPVGSMYNAGHDLVQLNLLIGSSSMDTCIASQKLQRNRVEIIYSV